MTSFINTIKLTRNFTVGGLSDFTLDQLNKIPTGFNNNIIWNLGHLVAVQQDLCYTRAGLDMKVDTAYYEKYKRDSKPEGYASSEELEGIKHLLSQTLDQLIVDYENRIFENYTPFTTRTGVELKNINDAIHFLLFHEGLHGGVIMTLKRLVK